MSPTFYDSSKAHAANSRHFASAIRS